MDILDFLLGVAVGIALYHVFLSFMARKLFRDLALGRELLEENKEGEEEVINANIEEHNNQFLFYDTETNQFLLQASNYQEVFKKMTEHMNNPTLVVHGDPAVIERFYNTKSNPRTVNNCCSLTL
jgi:MFS superfamily sulfate permease-like transporter